MKKFFILLLLNSSLLSATDYINDIKDFYVQGNELNDSLSAINLYTCFIGNGISRGALLNKGPYKVLTNEDLCINRFSPILSQNTGGYVAKSAGGDLDNTNIEFKDISYNESIFNVTKASQTAPLNAKVWSTPFAGSTNPAKLPQKIFYDFSISKLACNEALEAANIPCSKYGNLTLEYSYYPTSDWRLLSSSYNNLGLDVGRTAGLGKIVVADNTVDYVAHAGQSTYNVKLTNNGSIATGVFEKFRTSPGTWPWAIGYRFYMDTAQDKRFFCQKYDYAKLLAYIIPWDPANPSNHGSNYHAFADTNNKAGPKRVTDHNDLLPSSPSAVTDHTAYVKTGYIDPGYGIDEACFNLDKNQVKTVVDHYRLYDSNGAKIDLSNKAFGITAKAIGSNDFPGNNMYAWANKWGVWLDHKYNNFVDENTVWKNSNPNVTAAERAKTYTMQRNSVIATKITVNFIALDELHRHDIQMYVRDEYWKDEYKELGFCGTDGQTQGGQACTFYSDYVGYYDKTLNGLDGNNSTQGGFVFNKYYNCDPDGCASGNLTGSNIIQFENTQWLNSMAKTFGSKTYYRDLHLIDKSARKYFRIRPVSLVNQTSNTTAHGLKNTTHENVALSTLPTTLFCIVRCINPTALNTSYQNLLIEAAAIASDANQSWEKSDISGNTDRAPGSTPYFDVGAYIKSSETTGGTLTIDTDHNPGTANQTRTNAVGTYWDGIRDDQKITYTVSNNKIFQGSDEITFNTTNKNTLSTIKNVNSYLSGARVSTGYAHYKPYVSWGVEGYLISQSELDKAECDKEYNDFNTSNNEYKYRPGWTEAQSGVKRYCLSKFYFGEVGEYYKITFRTAPVYNLMEGNSVVTFSKPKQLKLVIPANQNYATEFHGQTYYLTFNGDGSNLWGLPKERYDTQSGNIIEDSAAWQQSHKMVDKFVIVDGQEVTDTETGATYRIRALRGQKYLKPLLVSDALTLIGGGASSVPYDMNATIASSDILRDISSNGTSSNYIGAEPTELLNEGKPCIVDGVKNKEDSAGCPFWSWSN